MEKGHGVEPDVHMGMVIPESCRGSGRFLTAEPSRGSTSRADPVSVHPVIPLRWFLTAAREISTDLSQDADNNLSDTQVRAAEGRLPKKISGSIAKYLYSTLQHIS